MQTYRHTDRQPQSILTYLVILNDQIYELYDRLLLSLSPRQLHTHLQALQRGRRFGLVCIKTHVISHFQTKSTYFCCFRDQRSTNLKCSALQIFLLLLSLSPHCFLSHFKTLQIGHRHIVSLKSHVLSHFQTISTFMLFRGSKMNSSKTKRLANFTYSLSLSVLVAVVAQSRYLHVLSVVATE